VGRRCGANPARRGFHLRAPLFGSDIGTRARPGTYTTSGRVHRLGGISLVPRNTPCPCGSGKKYKRCCLDRERELVRNADAFDELFGLASMFPLLRPDSPEFDAWVDARREAEVTRASIEEAGALLPAAERERIVRAHAQEFPGVWRSLVDDLGDEHEAEQVVFVGAVVAALEELRAVDPSVLELIEENEVMAGHPVEALALALEATDLWSIAEATAADEALAKIPDVLADDAYEILWIATIEAEAARLWSPRHEGRLARLVERLSAQLPIAGRANASAVLADGCAWFERDEEVRFKLAAMLLADSLDPLQQAQILAAVAA
jgi:hypothetical protein